MFCKITKFLHTDQIFFLEVGAGCLKMVSSGAFFRYGCAIVVLNLLSH